MIFKEPDIEKLIGHITREGDTVLNERETLITALRDRNDELELARLLVTKQTEEIAKWKAAFHESVALSGKVLADLEAKYKA